MKITYLGNRGDFVIIKDYVLEKGVEYEMDVSKGEFIKKDLAKSQEGHSNPIQMQFNPEL